MVPKGTLSYCRFNVLECPPPDWRVARTCRRMTLTTHHWRCQLERRTHVTTSIVNMSHKNQTCTGRALLLCNICLGLCTIYTWQYISGWDMFFFVQVDGAMCTCFCHLFFSRRFLHGTASLYQPLLRRHAIVVIMIAFLVVAMTRDIKQHIIKKMVPIPCACSGSDDYSIWIFLRGDPRFLSTWFAVHTVWAFCK